MKIVGGQFSSTPLQASLRTTYGIEILLIEEGRIARSGPILVREIFSKGSVAFWLIASAR